MKIVVVGTGGVGAYFGSRLLAGGAEVHFLTTPRQVEAISAGGVTVVADGEVSVHHPASVSADAAQIGPADAVLLAVKWYQLDAALKAAAPLIRPSTVLIPLQNGVTAPEVVAQQFGPSHVAPGIASLISFLEAPGRIRHVGRRAGLIVSDKTLTGENCGACAELVATLDRCGVDARTTDSIERELWKKFALITTFGGVCALADAPLGPVRSFPGTRNLLVESLQEVQNVAGVYGVTLDAGDLEHIMTQLDASAWEATSSMQRDLSEGKPSELDHLNGELVRLADRKKVPVPLQRTIVAVLALRETMVNGD